eukprot:6750790-Pyramimonas_sp.AAC.1
MVGSASRDAPGITVLDAACQMTMHGAPWRMKYEEAARARDLQPIQRSREIMFRGVGGDAHGDTVYKMPAGIANSAFTI